MKLPEKIVKQCRQRLVDAKTEILNRVRDGREALYVGEKGGDEADQSARLLAETDVLNRQERLRMQLIEIETALARMERGTYGLCEETDEPIETERLLAIPWTRLSIEGAELREAVAKRYAR